MINEHLKFLMDNKIHAPLLREFVYKGLWKPAIMDIDFEIAKRNQDIENLKQMKINLQKEVDDATERVDGEEQLHGGEDGQGPGDISSGDVRVHERQDPAEPYQRGEN